MWFVLQGSEYLMEVKSEDALDETLSTFCGKLLEACSIFSDLFSPFETLVLEDLTEDNFGELGGEADKFILSFVEILLEALFTRSLVFSLALVKAPKNELDILT